MYFILIVDQVHELSCCIYDGMCVANGLEVVHLTFHFKPQSVSQQSRLENSTDERRLFFIGFNSENM